MLTDAAINLRELVGRMAGRTSGRTEANVQAELHSLLLAAPLQLEEGHLLEIVLEQPTGKRRRIDVEVGYCVFEVKRDLRRGNVRTEAEKQLGDYVALRMAETGQSYVGVLTDGSEWRLYRLHASTLTLVSSLELSADEPDVDGLLVWLEGVLATGELLSPTPSEIERLLGAGTPGYLLNVAALTELYEANKHQTAVRLKRHLWARLLRTALGTAFTDDDDLFIRHSLLVVMAEIIAHGVIDLDANLIPPLALVSGQHFRAAKVLGVVESDFFDWPAEVPDGDKFIRGLARRVSRFQWADVDHDILKVLYESIISAAQRKQLGEYYTPDWLAEKIVDSAIHDPIAQRVLDPSCGSGTFLFHAVRRYLAAADDVGVENSEALAGLCSSVFGVDLHPVAVTLARVTYLMAIGPDRLQAERGPISIPVFLGDSLQWGLEETVLSHGELVVAVDEGSQLFESELRFPDSLVADAGRFDALVAELADLASNRPQGSSVPSLVQANRRFAMSEDELRTVGETFRLMCSLHDQGRNHIWGYYVRNLARPRWLARSENRVDVVLGNPPWLSYRFMTSEMQQDFQRWSRERNLWAGGKSATHVDLSALFVVRSIERYLKQGGTFAFVMPYAALSRQHFAGFRTGNWPLSSDFPIYAAFETAWDLHAVKPTFFEVPCSVVRGRRADGPSPVPNEVLKWEGRLKDPNVSWADAERCLQQKTATIKVAGAGQDASPLAARFSQGASLVPRMILFVEELPSGRLGTASGEVRIRSRRTAFEKRPWKDLPSLEGIIEKTFIFPVHLGETLLPFRVVEPLLAAVPWDGKLLLDRNHARLSAYPGMHQWWKRAEECWETNRSSERLSLIQQIDFRKKLSNQFNVTGTCAPLRVAYTKSGMYLAAAIITDPTAIIDHKLYWAACSSMEEARYLCAILNSEAVTLAVRSYQARGEHNPRDFDKYVWELAIPAFDHGTSSHAQLAELAEAAEALVSTLELPRTRFEKQRRFVREQLAETTTGRAIEEIVAGILSENLSQ